MSDASGARASVRRPAFTVLMTADAVGGVWTYALTLARALAGRGVRTVLATMGARPAAAQRAEAHAVDGLVLEESDYRLEWMDGAFAASAGEAHEVERAGEWLLALERRHRPDLVQVNGFAHAALAFRAPVLLVAHSSVCTWFRAVKGVAAPASYDAYRAAVSAGLSRAQLVVAPTAAMLNALLDEYPEQRRSADIGDRSRVIANGIDDEPATPDARVRSDGATRSRARIVASGRLWDEAKNLAALERVAPDLAWPVRVAGSLASPDGTSTATAAGNVTLLGTLDADEMRRELASATIFAHPARYEPFGLAALEAARAGCALVLGDIPSLREVWADAALYVAPDDHDALLVTLRSLGADAELRARWSARARARSLLFTTRRMSDAYLSAYRSLLGDVVPVQLCG